MAAYSLQSNESVLYKGNATIKDKKGKAELMLTNLNVVIVFTVKKGLFSKAEEFAEVYPVQEIKIYEGQPQLKQKGTALEIYFTNYELQIHFDSILEITKFKMAATKLLTGKSAQGRGAEKVKGTLNLINDTLGIDTAGTIKGVLENGVVGTVLGGISKKSEEKEQVNTKNKLIGEALSLTEKVVNKSISQKAKTKEENVSFEEQVEALRKYRALLDEGLIDETEYNEKKKEIMGL